MSLNDTPSGERIHIGFFGKRNAGKSSIVNAITNQEMSVVSEVKGTTTDPVSKAMELLPLGAVLITDTAGYDDKGKLGEMRIRKTKQILNKTDIAVLVIDSMAGFSETDRELTEIFRQKKIPYIIVYNKSDLKEIKCNENEISVSTFNKNSINELKEKIASLNIQRKNKHIVGDLINENDLIILVTPIDESAPKGRLILPQQQTIRDILDNNSMAVVTKEYQLAETLKKIPCPKMVITDSQAFGYVSKIVPESIPLTSFSILMARYKGFLETAVKGASAIRNLNDGDSVLISEGCTHHRQCGDIGSVKIPTLLEKFTGKKINIKLSSGNEFPENLSEYRLIIHCGGCMLNEREVNYRMKSAIDQNVPFTNYGIALALMNGILKRSIEIFPELLKLI